MIDFDRLYYWIKEQIAARFYGKLIISIENGLIVNVKREENITEL